MAKKNNKKKKKNKLGALLLLLFLTIILLATSTYAWFTSNKNVTISNIDVTVTTGAGIQISTDASNWKTIVSNQDIKTGYTGDQNIFPAILNPASTDGTVTGGYLSMYDGVVSANTDGDFVLDSALKSDATETTAYDAAATAGTDYQGYYVAFDVFLRSDKASEIYLRVGSGAKAGETDTNIQNATRIAIINEGVGSINDPVATLTAMSGGTSSTIFEPYYQSHTAYGITQAGLYYGDYTYGESNVAAGISGSTLVAGDGNEMIITDGVSAPVTATLLEETNATDNATLFTPVEDNIGLAKTFCNGTGDDLRLTTIFPSFTANSTTYDAGSIQEGVTKLRIYLWVEGQDVDCENNASGGSIEFSLAFGLEGRTGVTPTTT